MSIIKNVINDQIKNNNSQIYKTSNGTVIYYDNMTNMATIEYSNPNGEGLMYRQNVPISNTLGGLVGSSIRVGKKVVLTFMGGNVMSPIITGVLGSEYSSLTTSDQGSTIINNYINDIEIPEEITPMYSEWIDESNDDISKYINEYSDFKDFDSEIYSFNLIKNIDHYSSTEQGITNINNKSTIKLKDNSDIDIFTKNNTGIRITNNNNKSEIQIFADILNFNGNILEIKDGQLLINNGNENSSKSPAINDILNITNIIKSIDDNIEEIKKSMALIVEIRGIDDSVFDTLNSRIKEYEKLKYKYLNEPIDDWKGVYKILCDYNDYFNKELAEATGDVSEI